MGRRLLRPSLAPWVEDPTPVLIVGFLRSNHDHDFDRAAGEAPGQRDETVARTIELEVDSRGRVPHHRTQHGG